MKHYLPEILAGLSILIAIFLVVHQQIVNGFWFHWWDFWHHQVMEAVFVAGAIGLLAGKYLGRL